MNTETTECATCEGHGGKSARWLGRDPESGDDVIGFQAYCDCPAGQQAQAEADRWQHYQEREAQAALLAELWAGAKVPAHFADCLLDSFPETPATQPPLTVLRQWLDTDRWLLLHGGHGVGKTGLAAGLLRELLARGQTGLFATSIDMLARVRATYGGDGQTEAGLSSIREVHILVLDDLGAERHTDWTTELLLSVLNHRHDWHQRTIITSNRTPSNLGEHIGERTFWRIVELADVHEVRGPNLRLRWQAA